MESLLRLGEKYLKMFGAYPSGVLRMAANKGQIKAFETLLQKAIDRNSEITRQEGVDFAGLPNLNFRPEASATNIKVESPDPVEMALSAQNAYFIRFGRHVLPGIVKQAANLGLPPAYWEQLNQAVEDGSPIKDWNHFLRAMRKVLE